MSWKEGAVTRRAAVQKKVNILQKRISDLHRQIMPLQKRKRGLVLKQQALEQRLHSFDEIIEEED